MREKRKKARRRFLLASWFFRPKNPKLAGRNLAALPQNVFLFRIDMTVYYGISHCYAFAVATPSSFADIMRTLMAPSSAIAPFDEMREVNKDNFASLGNSARQKPRLIYQEIRRKTETNVTFDLAANLGIQLRLLQPRRSAF